MCPIGPVISSIERLRDDARDRPRKFTIAPTNRDLLGRQTVVLDDTNKPICRHVVFRDRHNLLTARFLQTYLSQ